MAGAAPMATPNLLSRRPVEMYGCDRASMSGLTRSDTRTVRPAAAAAAEMRSISASLSALNSPMPRAMPSAISASVFPTPENTIRSGANPARSAASISPPETMSAPAPSAGEHAQDGRGGRWPSARSRCGAARGAKARS